MKRPINSRRHRGTDLAAFMPLVTVACSTSKLVSTGISKSHILQWRHHLLELGKVHYYMIH